MTTKPYEIIVIGGGSAGIVSANVAAALGVRTALVEKERVGGECLWTGCVPSKALIHAASAAAIRAGNRALGSSAAVAGDDRPTVARSREGAAAPAQREHTLARAP